MYHLWVDDVGQFQAIAKGWDEALLSSKDDNPFVLSDFILTWWKYYSDGLKLRIFVLCDDDDKVVGGIPLYLDRNGTMEQPGRIAANYTEPLSIVGKDVFWEFFLTALCQKKDWRRLALRRVRKKFFEEYGLSDASSRGAGMLLDCYEGGSSYMARVPEDFSGYMDKLPKKLRYYVKRSYAGLSKLGEVKLRSFSDAGEVGKLADEYIDLSIRSFRGRGRNSAFENNNYSSFFRELVLKFLDRGYLDANALLLDGRVIAIHFGYSIGNNLNYVFPVFDISLAEHNPGHLLIYKLMELGSLRGNRYFDLYTGYQFYKKQWSDTREDIIRLELRPRGMGGILDRFFSKAVVYPSLNLARRLKGSYA